MQVKGLMPPEDGINRKHPPAKPLGEICYDITFSLTKELLCHRHCFVYSALFSLLIFIGLCEWIDSDFYGIVCCQKGGVTYDEYGFFPTTLYSSGGTELQ